MTDASSIFFGYFVESIITIAICMGFLSARFLHRVSGGRNRFSRFIFSPKYRVEITEEGIVYKHLFRKSVTINWNMIRAVKLSVFQGIVVVWTKTQKPIFFTRAYRLGINRRMPGFTEKVNSILDKSKDAAVDQRIREFLQIPGDLKFSRLRKILGVFMVLFFFISGFSLAVFSLELDSMISLTGFFLATGLFIAATFIISKLKEQWDDDKWGYFLDISNVCLYFIIPGAVVVSLISTGMFIIRFMLVVFALMLPVCVFVVFPRINMKNILRIFIVSVFVIYNLGNAVFFDSRVRIERFHSIDLFTATSIGWFPDGSKIYAAGSAGDLLKGIEGPGKMLIFDAFTGELLETFMTGFLLDWISFRWSPAGLKLVIVESHGEKDNKRNELHILDLQTLEKKLVLSGQRILLHEGACWNGDKLAGLYRENRNEELMVFLIDTNTGKIGFFEGHSIDTAFWLPDGTVGLLSLDVKTENGKLHKPVIKRIGESLSRELIYEGEEWGGNISVSPGSDILYMRTPEDGYPVFIDITSGTRHIPVYKDIDRISWAPDGKKVLFLHRKDTEDEVFIYELANRRFRKLLSGKEVNWFTLAWSLDSNSFTISFQDIFPSSMLFVLADGSPVTMTRPGRFFSSFSTAPLLKANYDGSRLLFKDISFFQSGTNIYVASVKD